MNAIEMITEADVRLVLYKMGVAGARYESDEVAIRVRFEDEGQHLSLAVLHDLANFVVLATHLDMDNDITGVAILARCNRINCSMRYVKLQYVPESHSVLISVEWAATSADALAFFLTKYMMAIQIAAQAITN